MVRTPTPLLSHRLPFGTAQALSTRRIWSKGAPVLGLAWPSPAVGEAPGAARRVFSTRIADLSADRSREEQLF